MPNFFLWFSPNLDFLEQILVKVSNIKFHKNLPSGSQADISGQVGAELINVDKQMDMTKQLALLATYANTPKKSGWHIHLEKQTNSHLSDNDFPNGRDYKIKKETAPIAMSQRGMKRLY